MPVKAKDLVGIKYGKWLVLSRFPNGHRDKIMWECRCVCGLIKPVSSATLKNGESKSCGCAPRPNVIAAVTKRNMKHGFSIRGKKTRLYRIWSNIKTRCYNTNNKHYTAKKLIMDAAWFKDFINFYNWALFNGYKDNLEIDRIDNTKGYHSNNCRWISHKENCNNTKSNVNYKFNGEIKNLTQISVMTGLDRSFLRSRLLRGYSIEDAVSKPKKVNQWK